MEDCPCAGEGHGVYVKDYQYTVGGFSPFKVRVFSKFPYCGNIKESPGNFF